MRIAIDGSHGVLPGGVRTYLENLVPALSRVDPRIDLQVLLRGRTARLADRAPWSERTVPIRWPRKLLDLSEHFVGIPRVERFTGAVDVIHGTHFSLPRGRRGVPAILSVHDVAYLRRPDLYDDHRGNDYGYRVLLRRSLRRADRVIACSHHTMRDLIELLGVDPDRIWLVPHGLDTRFGPVAADESRRVRERWGLDGEWVIYPIGTITPRKNIEGVLLAFSIAFPDPRDRPTLLLTGPSELPIANRHLIETLGLARSVRSLSVGYPDELAALLAGAGWGLYPSLYEGFGFPPLEAMACGVPMLVSERTSCPEVTGEAALTVDPTDIEGMADAMRRLHSDSELRAELRERGLRRAADPGFSWDRVARQTLAVYRGDRAAHQAEIDPTARPEGVPAPDLPRIARVR